MYDLPRHRYLELKHYCLQYWNWKKACYILDGTATSESNKDVTAYTAVKKTDLEYAIQLIETTALNTDSKLSSYILRGVTENITTKELDPPVGSSIFLTYKKRFYYLLSKKKGI